MTQPSDLSPFIKQLFDLTAAPFTCDAIAERCLSYGWRCSSELPSNFDIEFWPTDNLRLWVGLCDGSEPLVALVVVYWYDEDDYPTKKAYEEGRQDFDAAYDGALAKMAAVLGAPHVQGQYPPRRKRPFRYAIWPGESALFILQQHNRDPQFGQEVNVWLQPWTEGEPIPQFPLC
jgi:hypothetical protein